MASVWRLLITAIFVATALTTSTAIDCVSGNIDAITKTSDGNYYAFDGRLVVRLTSNGSSIECGYPKLISDVFSGLPDNLDAAIHWPNGKTYFFKGSQYWRTTGTSVDSDYPAGIGNWPGLPGNIDAAILWQGEERAYFFKGLQYWRYDLSSNRVDSGYPTDTSGNWGTYSTHVDASLIWSNGHCYLFKAGSYWRYNIAEHRIDSGYPFATNEYWFGCPL